MKITRFTLAFWMLSILRFSASAQSAQINYAPDTVVFKSGKLLLKGFLWKPAGEGPFPAVLYNHGSEANPQNFLSKIVPAFIEHGYAFFVPFRRGQGFSKGQGRYIIDDLEAASRRGGQLARFESLMRLQETSQLQDQMAGLRFLKDVPGIDSTKIVIVGHSFGGIQTILMATANSGAKAAVNFAGASMVWDKSPEVVEWLKRKIRLINIPMYFVQASNDFSIRPSIELSNELKKIGKTYEVRIYPPNGKTEMSGHNFKDATGVWGVDVFPVLEKWMSAP